MKLPTPVCNAASYLLHGPYSSGSVTILEPVMLPNTLD